MRGADRSFDFPSPTSAPHPEQDTKISGAHLDLHDFSSSEEQLVLINEAFDAAKVLNNIVVTYANEMMGIDLAILSDFVTVVPSNIYILTTPREIRRRGIEVKGKLVPRPTEWGLNAFTRERGHKRRILDGGIEWQTSSKSSEIVVGTIEELRASLLDDVYSLDGFVRDKLSLFFAEESSGTNVTTLLTSTDGVIQKKFSWAAGRVS